MSNNVIMNPGDLFSYSRYLRIAYNKKLHRFMTISDEKCREIAYKYMPTKDHTFLLIEEIKFEYNEIIHPEFWMFHKGICWKIFCEDASYWTLIFRDETKFLTKLNK
jgi:hypothetical protein